MKEIQVLLEKYNKPVPRYTSYPAVPFWYSFDEIHEEKWKEVIKNKSRLFNNQTGMSLYIHLPFCESLCTYCGCNKKITTNHNVEEEYIDLVLKEWQLYCGLLNEMPVIRELHLGGGTPTFFSPANLQKLMNGLLNNAVVHPQKEFSFEGHPNNTTKQHLQTLFNLGFTRVSHGVQDNDPVVQRAINRIQPLSNVRAATENARAAGYRSVNFDLIYGLPFQTLKSMEKTIKEIIQLKPDRIAFYSYAHVPWKQRSQRLFDESDLPGAGLKMQLYMLGKTLLASAGYTDIGMDHFALPHDDLYKEWQKNNLHRNFMGYTITHTKILCGLGVSAISDFDGAYAQNHKELENYYRSINNNKLAVTKGYFPNNTDGDIKQYILDIACKGQTILQPKHDELLMEFILPSLLELEKDGLVTIDGNRLKVTNIGKHFIRNICHAFDVFEHSAKSMESKNVFSKAV